MLTSKNQILNPVLTKTVNTTKQATSAIKDALTNMIMLAKDMNLSSSPTKKKNMVVNGIKIQKIRKIGNNKASNLLNKKKIKLKEMNK